MAKKKIKSAEDIIYEIKDLLDDLELNKSRRFLWWWIRRWGSWYRRRRRRRL